MRLAAIDIGTNSVLLLVAERGADGQLRALEERCEITRLGRGVDASGALQDAAMKRTLEALSSFSERAHALGVEALEIVGTSALRDARNGSHFVSQAEELLGESVSIISGQREAALVLAGVQTSFGTLPAGSLVFDVGGGSTEFVSVNPRGGVAALRSLDIGCVRLTERFIGHDPPTDEELALLRAAVKRALEGLPGSFVALYQQAPAALLVGVSGTMTTLYTIDVGMTHYDASRVDGKSLSARQLLDLTTRLSALQLGRRRALAGLEPRRADVIVAGSLIVTEIMDLFGANQVHVADRGVRWGLLSHLASSQSGEHERS